MTDSSQPFEINVNFDSPAVRARGRDLIRTIIGARVTHADADAEGLNNLIAGILDEYRQPTVLNGPTDDDTHEPLEDLISSLFYSTVDAAAIINRLLTRLANLEGETSESIWRSISVDLDRD